MFFHIKRVVGIYVFVFLAINASHSQAPDNLGNVTVVLKKLHETESPVNSIPNDYGFPEPTVANTGADMAKIKKSGEAGFDSVKIDRSNLILIASDSSQNPQPTINCDWDVTSPSSFDMISLRANVTHGGNLEHGQKALDSDGKIDYQLQPNSSAMGSMAWSAFIDDPHILTKKSIGKIILISQGEWNTERTVLTGGAVYGNLALNLIGTTMLGCFLGTPSATPFPPSLTSGTKQLSKGDIWYDWLTHKVGLTWSGEVATVRVLEWSTNTAPSLAVGYSEEYYQCIIGKIRNVLFSPERTEGVRVGDTETIEIESSEVEYLSEDEGGSSDDLNLAYARARLSGTISVEVLEDPNHVPGRYLLRITQDMELWDLYDFNYFNYPGWIAATVQAGWNKYSGVAGGAGNVFFTKTVVNKTEDLNVIYQ